MRTQHYLSALLAANGHKDDIVLLNGQNNDPQSKAIYQDWLAKNKGTDAVSGSKTADMKAAIVEAFRDKKSILIATESGAEGINLQFCSLLVNFDLPWNPQRVEQRIGRCHRYGQKIDVTVVNFLNLKNHAEFRIHQLLDIKFNLFKGVFGASDEVLGVIERGVDIERRIFQIVQNARSETEIDAAFDKLQEELQAQIATALGLASDAFTMVRFVPNPTTQDESQRHEQQLREEWERTHVAVTVCELRGSRDVLPLVGTHAFWCDEKNVAEVHLKAFERLKDSFMESNGNAAENVRMS